MRKCGLNASCSQVSTNHRADILIIPLHYWALLRLSEGMTEDLAVASISSNKSFGLCRSNAVCEVCFEMWNLAFRVSFLLVWPFHLKAGAALPGSLTVTGRAGNLHRIENV